MKIASALLLVIGAASGAAAQSGTTSPSPSAPAAPTIGQGSTASALPSEPAVAAFYKNWKQGPIWFRAPASAEAVGELAAILRRAPAEGFAEGPLLATRVEAALRLAASGRPRDIAVADQAISAIWVFYVRWLKRLPAGVSFGHPSLAPQGKGTPEILPLAFAAHPSLRQHVETVSRVNPIYADLRGAAWAQMQAAGTTAPDPRILQNLDRARVLPAGGRFVLVNVATQRLSMYEDGRPVDSMKVIVGTRELPTPMIASKIQFAVFNPYWNVPDHLVRKMLAPKVLKQGVGYLRNGRYQVMANWSDDAAPISPAGIDWKAVATGQIHLRVREKPGPGNSMGRLKFPFPNGHGIYLHDTPNKNLFAKDQRTLSNGCIRLEDAARFGRWLLGREPVAPSADPEIRAHLADGVPVYVTYLTAQPTGASVTFAKDVYGWDATQSAQASVTPAAAPRSAP